MPRYHNIDGVRVQFTAEEETARDAQETAWANGEFDREIAKVRAKRNSLLAETDWTANSDVTMTAEMTSYRQALRDITNGVDTVEKINAITWPTKP